MEDILWKREGNLFFIMLNRQERYNALDKKAAQALYGIVKESCADKTIKCIILTSLGKGFCCGVDLKSIEQNKEDDAFDTTVYKDIRDEYGTAFKEILYSLHETIYLLHTAPQIVLAGVKGIAAAGGIGLALACDLVYATPNASFEWAYWKTALTSAEGSTYALPRILGLQKAKELVLFSPRITAQQAKEMGMINDIFVQEEFDVKITELAKRVAFIPSETLAVTKRLLNRSFASRDIRTHLDIEFHEIGEIIKTNDFYEGIKAFVEKRVPRFDNTQSGQS